MRVKKCILIIKHFIPYSYEKIDKFTFPYEALIPAAILANGPVTICGVPSISDVESLSVLLRDLGVVVDIRSSDSIVIDPTQMENKPLIHEAVNKLRASYYFMGALLGKYGHAEIRMPGGCYLGPRPIDLHLKGF